MSFDLSSVVDSATTSVTNAVTSAAGAVGNAISGVGDLLSSGPASALSAVTNGITSAISSLTGGSSNSSNVKLPIPNPLFSYASYDYILGLGALEDGDINGSAYRTKQVPLIAKTANIDPDNRVSTAYGKFDFFIDDVTLHSEIGFGTAIGNTNVTNISFKVVEPYSMGLFIQSLQKVAQKLGHANWRDAPFLLTIDFRGNKETGQMDLIQGCSRKIPIQFTELSMTVNAQGSTYSCSAMVWVQAGLSDKASLFKSDVAAVGTTVQEILQTGENSLQAVLNRRAQEMVDNNSVNVADQYVIMFPTDPSNGGSDNSDGSTEDNSSATATSYDYTNISDVTAKLGLSISTINNTLVQQEGDCNELGKAKLGFNEERKGDPAAGKENKVFQNDVYSRSSADMSIDVKQSEMRFTQDTSIPSAINNVLLQSDYVKDALAEGKLTAEGYRTWWRVDVQVYNQSTDANLSKTGIKPKIIIYRVVPYYVHNSRMLPANTKGAGTEALKFQAVKNYEYIYTGHNVDIINFNIKIDNGFSVIMGADNITRTQDRVTEGQSGAAAEPQANSKPLPDGNSPSPESTPTTVTYDATLTKSDRQGGGGMETQATRAARLFQDALSQSTDLYNLDLEIIGDPYYITDSGVGNYTASSTKYKNLNADGAMDWQNGEVDINVTFRTPVDINQTTGLYDFGKSSKSAPVLQYSGLYCVQTVVSKLSGGKFTQKLSGFRRPQQENLFEADPSQVFNTTTTKADKEDTKADDPAE